MNLPSQSLRRLTSPQVRSRDDAEGAAASAPSTEAVAPPSLNRKGYVLSDSPSKLFGNMAAQFRAKAGE